MSTFAVLSPADDQLLPRPAVLRRYNISDMSLWRWQHSADPDFSFPAPIYIGARAYYRLSELLEFERRCAARGPAMKAADMPEGRRRFRGRRKQATEIE
jgi:predicted DNA-binding transcriptional regulator AlpA